MLDWLKRMFTRPPAHPTAAWTARTDAQVGLDIRRARLVVNGSPVELGDPMERLRELGRPALVDTDLPDFLSYPERGLLCTTEEGVVDGFALDFEGDVHVEVLDGETTVQMRDWSEARTVEVFGEPSERVEEDWDGTMEVTLVYEVREFVTVEWSFSDGKLSSIDCMHWGDDADESGDDETSDDGDADEKEKFDGPAW